VEEYMKAEKGSGPIPFKPVRYILPDGKTKTPVMIYMVKNYKMEVPEYDELILNFVVSDTPDQAPVTCVDDGYACIPVTMGLFKTWMAKLWLSNDLGIVFGREMYGINKVKVQKCVIHDDGQRVTGTFDNAFELDLDISSPAKDTLAFMMGAARQVGIGTLLSMIWDKVSGVPTDAYVYTSRAVATIANFDNHFPLDTVSTLAPETYMIKYDPARHKIKSNELDLSKISFAGVGMMRNYLCVLKTAVNIGSGPVVRK
jgi:hypothetical protein